MDVGKSQAREAVIEKVRSMGARLNLSETMFPVSVIVDILECYAVGAVNGVGPETWVMDTLIDIGLPFESLFSALEGLFYRDEAPLQGKNRRHIANEILYVVRLWLQDSSRGAGGVLGGESNAAAISQVLQTLQPMLDAQRGEECQMLRMRIEHVLR